MLKSTYYSGFKFVMRGNLDGDACTEDRYQPYKFKTNGSSRCIFEKSACLEDGQILHDNRNSLIDRTCRCDYTNGYAFVRNPKNSCYCIPSEEDCSCYKKSCSSNTVLTPGNVHFLL